MKARAAKKLLKNVGVKTLKLEPGEVLVVNLKNTDWFAQDVLELQTFLKDTFPKNKSVVVYGEMYLTKISGENE